MKDLIVIAGTPRSGSTWCYEVTAEICRRHGMVRMIHKSHLLNQPELDAVLEGAPCITSIRWDVRASVESYLKRPKTEQEDHPLSRYEITELTCQSIAQAARLPGLKLTHGLITRYPAIAVGRILRYLGLSEQELPVEALDIAAMFSKERVQQGGIGRMFQKPGHITDMGQNVA